MLRISLVVMPVVDLHRPSISLTQLRSVVEKRHGDRVAVEILYLNQEFAKYLSQSPASEAQNLHQVLLDNQHTGLPDWFFRQAAFPHLPDNTKQYFRRFYPGRAASVQAMKDAIQERRQGLERFLDELIDRYRLDEAGIAGFCSMFGQNAASFAMARKLKERRPDITVVMGGANCESPMGQVIAANVPAVDYVFSGPALVGFPEFVQHQLEGAVELRDSIPGVFSKARPDRASGEQAGVELPIDTEVDLDYSDFFESFERNFPSPPAKPLVLFETSRGCWWGERAHCTFCGLNGASMAYRSMAPDKATTLIRSLFDRYRSKTNEFFCVDNILPRNYVEEVLPHLDSPPGTSIFYEVKADLSDDDLRVLSRAGVDRIQPGIEALATSTLKLMKKGTTVFDNLRLMKSCVRHGVEPMWNLLVGFPGEPEEVYEKYAADLPRAVHLTPPQGVAAVRFDRYSPYFVKAEEYGLKLRCFDFYSLIYPFDDDALSRMAYYFSDENYDAAYVAAISKWIGTLQERIAAWRGKWNGGAGAAPPDLSLRREDDAWIVRDTRDGAPVEHALSDAQARLLGHMEERPRRPRELAAFEEGAGLDIEAELRFLDERRLVWCEGERALSLVLPGEEPSAT